MKKCKCGSEKFTLKEEIKNKETNIWTRNWECDKCGKIQIQILKEFSDKEYGEHFQNTFRRDNVSVKDKFKYANQFKWIGSDFGFYMLAKEVKGECPE